LRLACIQDGFIIAISVKKSGEDKLDGLFCSTPLPPLPTEKKQLTVCSSETPSNRSSASSSSAYGHLLLSTEEQGTDDEDIYSKPMVIMLLLVTFTKQGHCD
jgi:hypothetical protein